MRIQILLFSSVTFKTPPKTFFAYYFLKVHLHHFSKIKVMKNSQNIRNQCFSWWWKDPESDPVLYLLTNGSGTGGPKNIWILRIRIRNTGCDFGIGSQAFQPLSCVIFCPSQLGNRYCSFIDLIGWLIDLSLRVGALPTPSKPWSCRYPPRSSRARPGSSSMLPRCDFLLYYRIGIFRCVISDLNYALLEA